MPEEGAAVDEEFLMDVEEIDGSGGERGGVPGHTQMVDGEEQVEEEEDEEPLDTVRRNTRRRRR
jgi:hypothetical protein